MDDYCKRNNVNWQKFYPALKKDFGIDGSYSDIPAKDFDAVIEYICGEVVEEQFFSRATREQFEANYHHIGISGKSTEWW